MPRPNDSEMSIIEHLEELRWHLLKSVVAIFVCAIVVFVYDDFFLNHLLFDPLQVDFFSYHKLCQLGAWLEMKDSFCLDKINITLQNTEPAGQFMTYITSGFTIGFIIAFPYVFFQIWSFIKPALLDGELRVASGLLFWTTLLFLCGIMFGYYILLPFSINFLSSFSMNTMIKNDINVSSYFDLLTSLVLGCGIMFEMPIVVYFLTKIGLVTPAFLTTYRKYSIVVILVIAAIITPPDVISQLIVSVPLFILYEISIYVSMRIVLKEKLNQNNI